MSRILLIEDERLAQRFVTLMFEARNYEVDIAATGEEALNYLKTDQVYEFILLDLGLPDMDGLQVIREYHVFNSSSQKKAPVILLTAQGIENLNFESYGIIDYVNKPLLEEAVDEYIKKWKRAS